MAAQPTSQGVGQNLLSTVSPLGHGQAWRGQDGHGQLHRRAPAFGEDGGEGSRTPLPLLLRNAGAAYLHLEEPLLPVPRSASGLRPTPQSRGGAGLTLPRRPLRLEPRFALRLPQAFRVEPPDAKRGLRGARAGQVKPTTRSHLPRL